MKKLVLASAVALTAIAMAPGASAQVLSADFETDFGPFVASGNVSRANGATYQACCGTDPAYTNFFAAFGGGNAPSGFISSAFSTIVGRSYTVSFDYGALGNGSEPLLFSVGSTSSSVTPTANNDLFSTFQQGSFTFTGTGSPLSLSITSGGVSNVDAIVDNVSVTLAAVPEPATWALMILGFGAVGGAMRRRTAVRTAVTYA